MDTQTNRVGVKSFNELCDMISNAKQCMSQYLDIDEHTMCENIRAVLKYVNIDALILTKQNMLFTNNISNIIFCDDDIGCMFINNRDNFVIYYSPNNKAPSLLIQRLLSIHCPRNKVIILPNDRNAQLYNLCNWKSVTLFVVITSMHKEYNNTELIESLSNQLTDNEFRKNFDELSNIVTSNQSCIIKMNMTRTSCINDMTYKASQNLNNVLDILHDIVSWSCMMIRHDENVRDKKLYFKLQNSYTFETGKKHMRISRTIVYETILKLWNRLTYELTLNVGSAQLITQVFQNIMHCLNTHYKYLVYVLVNLLQSGIEDNIISHHSIIILSITEEYEDKIKKLTKLADDMDSLICDVTTLCRE